MSNKDTTKDEIKSTPTGYPFDQEENIKGLKVHKNKLMQIYPFE